MKRDHRAYACNGPWALSCNSDNDRREEPMQQETLPVRQKTHSTTAWPPSENALAEPAQPFSVV